MAKPIVKVANITDVSGEVNIAGGNIVKNIQTIYERSLTAGEEAAKGRELEKHKLAEGLSAFIHDLQIRAAPATDASDPYKGLLPYNLNEAEIFFGRQKATDELLKCLGRGPLTILHAESGAGKTSLLQAGLAARLIASGHLAIRLRPHNADPVEFIKRTFLPDLDQAPGLEHASLCEFLRQVGTVLGPQTSLYLLLDQFEEFFSLLKKKEREPFLQALSECLDDPILKVRWIIALRAESLSELAELEKYGIKPFENTYRLNRLNRSEAYEAVAEPAARHGLTFEAGLVNAILDALERGGEIAPTQLQLVCSALSERLPAGEQVSLQQYERQGGAEGILRDYLKRQLEGLPAGEQSTAWKILRALVTSDRQRAVCTHTELAEELRLGGVTGQIFDVVLQRLVERRLVTIQPGVVESLELSHEYLVKEIELDPQEQSRKAAQELLDQEVRTYLRYNTLLSAGRLAVIKPHRSELRFSPEAEKLFSESQKVARRVRMALIGGISIIVALLILAVIIFSRQSNANAQLAHKNEAMASTAQANAEIALSKQLAAQAINLESGQYDLALLLARRAYQFDPTHESQAALLEVLENNPKLQVFLKHNIPGTAPLLAFSSDSKFLALSICTKTIDICQQSAIEIWNITTGKLESGPFSFDGRVAVKAFFPDDRSLALLVNDSSGNYVMLWSLSKRESVEKFDHNAADLAFTPDGKTMVTVGFDRKIVLWDVGTGLAIGEPLNGYQNDVISVAINPAGTLFATGGRDGVILFWDLASRKMIGSPIYPGVNPIFHLSFSPIGKQLVALSYDAKTLTSYQMGALTLWDVDTRTLQYKQTLGGMYGVAFNPQGTVLAYGNMNNIVLLDMSDLKSQTILRGQLSSMIIDLDFSPDGNTLASISSLGDLILWNINSDHRLQHQIDAKTGDWVQMLKFIPSTQAVAAAWDNNSTVDLWDITSGKQVGQFESGRPGGIKSLAISSDGRVLATGGSDHTVLLWDISQKKLLDPPLSGHTGLVMGLAFSPDGQYLVSSAFEDEFLRLWNIEQHKLVSTFNTSDFYKNQISRIAFSPDGKSFAACGISNNIVIWDLASKSKRIIPFTNPDQSAGCGMLEYSPNGSMIVVDEIAASMSIIVIKISTGDVIANLNLQDTSGTATSFAFSADGTRLAAAFCIDFPACLQGSIAIWDMNNFQSLGQFPIGFMQSTNTLAFSPDNQVLITGGKSGQIIAWDVSINSWLYRACLIANRNLSKSEWNQYIGSESPYMLTCPELPAGEGVPTNNLTNSTPLGSVGAPLPLFQSTGFSLTETTADIKPVIAQNNTVTPPGGWQVQEGSLPDSLQFEFPAIIQCRASADSDNYVQQFFGVWALKNPRADQWISNGKAHVTLLDSSGNEITRYPVTFTAGNNTIDWLMPDENANLRVLNNNVSPETVFRLEIDNVEWQKTSDQINDYKADISVQSHILYGNPQYPQHMVVFAVHNLGQYTMKGVSVFSVVQNSEGKTVDLTVSGTGMDLASGERGYFTARSISATGRCVGKGDEKGYVLHYWVSFSTEDGKQQQAEIYNKTDLTIVP